jgi:hypothetical protein
MQKYARGLDFRRSLQAQMDAQKKKDSTKSISKRSQNTFSVTIHALKV